MRPRLRWVFLAAFALLLATAGVVAAASAAEGSEPNPAEAPVGTLFRWLNFLLVLGAGGYVIAKHLPAWFRGRAQAVADSITEAAAAKASAEQKLREAEQKLAALGQEVAALRAAAQRDSAAEAERLRAATDKEAEKIERAARAEIEAAERAARLELKAIAARLAVQRADALIRERITPDARAALFQSFLYDLTRSAN